MIIPYYGETNPGFVALAKRTVEEVFTDTKPRRQYSAFSHQLLVLAEMLTS